MKQVKNTKVKGYSLYQLTPRDLAFLEDHSYQAGNILIFSARGKAKLGREIARANNLKTAQEFLSSLYDKDMLLPLEESAPQAEGVGAGALAGGAASLGGAGNEEQLQELLAQNEELKQSLNKKTQRIEELSFISLQNDILREELMEDLRQISGPTTIKTVAELDELRVRIVELEAQLTTEKNKNIELDNTVVVLLAEKSVLEHELAESHRLIDAGMQDLPFTTAADNDQELVLTNATGGVIQIYHEFPPIPKQSFKKKLYSQAWRVAFVLIGIMVAAYVLYLIGVIETMRSSGIDVQLYSDEVLARVRAIFGK